MFLLVIAVVAVKVTFFGDDDPPSPLTLETRLEEIAELRTARLTTTGTASFGKSAGAWWEKIGEFFVGDNATLAGTVTIDGYVDLRNLRPRDVTVEDDRVTLRVPQPRLGDPVLDVDSVRVLDESEGLFTRLDDVLSSGAAEDSELIKDLQSSLADQIAQRRPELLEMARDSATELLTALLEGLGFTDVTIEFGEGGA